MLTGHVNAAVCGSCHNGGLIRVEYRSGETFDVAICACATGQFFRTAGEAFVRRHLGGLGDEHQVGLVEEFE